MKRKVLKLLRSGVAVVAVVSMLGTMPAYCPDLSKYVVEDNAPIRRHSYRNSYWYPTYGCSYYNWYTNYLFNTVMWYWFF